MYNMLMTSDNDAWESPEWSIETSRFLEHTAVSISEQFKSLNHEIIELLKDMPTLFTYENGGSRVSRVGKITRIQRSSGYLRIRWTPYSDFPTIPPNVICDLYPALDIGSWESSRTHWAIKDIDLIETLRNANLAPPTSSTAPVTSTGSAFPYPPPYTFSANTPPLFPASSFEKNIDVKSTWSPPILPSGNNIVAPTSSPQPPVKVFISYSWDSEEHRKWVEALAIHLRGHSIDAFIEAWDVRGGQDLVTYMERSVKYADRVLVIFTESATKKIIERKGGIGYEHMLVTAEIMQNMDTFKFVPIVRQTTSPPILPPQFQTRMRFDLSDGDKQTAQLQELVNDLRNSAPGRPPLGGL